MNTGYGISFLSREDGQQTKSSQWVAKGEVDPGLIFSRTIDMPIQDPRGQWKVWVGFDNEKFLASPDVGGIQMFQYGGIGFTLFLTLVGMLGVRQIRRSQAILMSASHFEKEVSSLMDTLVASAGEMKTTTEAVATIADETLQRSTSVSDASTNAAQSSSQVAAAAEELSASIQEVTSLTHKSRDVVNQASSKADSAKEAINRLSERSGKVSEIIATINSIAEQINLLALNASIEAARAGDAGAGFAVVAGEVKHLAHQVAQATQEITGQISEMQNVTQTSVHSVDALLSIIHHVQESTHSVSTAIEQQTIATNEIVQNITLTADGAKNISTNIKNVLDGAEKTGSSSHNVLKSVTKLMGLSEQLKQGVNEFLIGLRRA